MVVLVMLTVPAFVYASTHITRYLPDKRIWEHEGTGHTNGLSTHVLTLPSVVDSSALPLPCR